MAAEIVLIDSDRPDYLKVGVWEVRGHEITVAYLGTVPTKTSHLGGHVDAPVSLAKLLLSEFQ
jgi:hypothetical protein